MQLVYYLPIITTITAVFFSWEVANRYRQRQGLHLLWWSIGIVCFGLGTLIESCVTLFGWHTSLFRLWYIAGALLGAAPLAQGTVYLLLNKKIAHTLAVFLSLFVVVASTYVFLTPLAPSLSNNGQLTGKVIVWKKVRYFSIFLNVYAVFFLGGGALLSAWRFYKKGREHYHRFVGNALITVGTFCAAAGGASARMGHTEILYIAELIALVIIYLGYRVNIKQVK